MTATRERRSDLDNDRAEPTWDERPILGRSRGLPWWGAVLLAFGLTAVAALVDAQRQDTLGKVFQYAYVIGCVAAICLVRRRDIFAPMVQPPLVFAIVAITANLALAPDDSGGLRDLVFSVGLPLTSNFPTMAIATGIALVLGIVRLLTQRDPHRGTRAPKPTRTPDRRPASDRPTKDRPAGDRRPAADRPSRDRQSPTRDSRDRTPPRRPRPESR
ncbi:DUF6542 domain-containing protein [Actinokineospora enzanensis]|uniref:DUF6542 domain-containing protein n=1 Tax=Actinokineospora enzanensis TaxID=155975 RepID=UPI00036C25BF|nr:DUF6542 domain-containing protein [Actinokineospora enzanensis]